MNDIDGPGAALDEPATRRSAGSRLAGLGDRLSKTFGSMDRAHPEASGWEAPGDFEYGGEEPDDGPEAVEPFPQLPFPVARSGYDRRTVDEHVAELEAEIAQLQAGARSETTVAEEIERIGEQTSAILLVAHDKAQETLRQAQEQADRCVADAATNAIAMTEEASRRLRQLDGETESIWRERARLIDDVRQLSETLATLARDAGDRFPAEPDRPDTPAAARRKPHPAPARQPLGRQEPADPQDL